MNDKPTVYQEAVDFREKVESGEIDINGYVSIPSFLGLLGYFDMVNESCSMMSDDYTLLRSDYEELKQERDILFDAHSKEMIRADEAEAKLLKDHEIAQFVNELTKIAKTYSGTEQMREHISKCVKTNLS